MFIADRFPVDKGALALVDFCGGLDSIPFGGVTIIRKVALFLKFPKGPGN